MKRSWMVMVGCCLVASAWAAETPKVDLKDPTIWQEKSASDNAQDKPCEVFTESACPGHEASKTDIQREADRREKNRWYTDMEKLQKN